MKVLGIGWIGQRSSSSEPMRAFLRDTLGLRLTTQEPDFVEAVTERGDRFEIFGQSFTVPPWQFAESEVMVGFLVEDIAAACDELSRVPGVELLGPLHRSPSGTGWQHFRAPDGRVYELTGRF